MSRGRSKIIQSTYNSFKEAIKSIKVPQNRSQTQSFRRYLQDFGCTNPKSQNPEGWFSAGVLPQMIFI